jgi:hypothetical protein
LIFSTFNYYNKNYQLQFFIIIFASSKTNIVMLPAGKW